MLINFLEKKGKEKKVEKSIFRHYLMFPHRFWKHILMVI